MTTISQETLVVVLREHEGVELISYGKPRDGFELKGEVPHWTSGYGGQYEMAHYNVPAGAMIAVGDLQSLDIADLGKLKEQLKKIDIYPTGHEGDFTGKDVDELKKWFHDRSVRDDKVNDQSPIAHAKKLTPDGLGQSNYDELVTYLADEMHLFKDQKNGGALVPPEKEDRKKIVTEILQGLSETVRYTRLDAPATAYQFQGGLTVAKQDGAAIEYMLRDAHKIIVVREDPKTKAVSVTPLDRAMLGQTYVTKDGQPLGDRGMVDLGDIIRKAAQIEAANAVVDGKPGYLKDIVEDGRGGRSSGGPAIS